MKKLVAILFFLAVSMPALAQWQLSPEDQQRFDSYYSRWQEYQQRSDRDQIVSMEKRMQDVYAHYGIPSDTPYWRVASGPHDEHEQWRHRLNPHDQERFDSYFGRWQQYQQANDRDQVLSMERRMQDVYSHYGIPANTPYDWVATNGRHEEVREERREERREEWREEQQRASLPADDQARFDSLYTRWREARRRGDDDDSERLAHHMRRIMEANGIPPDTRFEDVASPGAGY
jgi:hypothetical protein